MKLSKIIILIIGAICISCSKYDTDSLEGTVWLYEDNWESEEIGYCYETGIEDYYPVNMRETLRIKFLSDEYLSYYAGVEMTYDRDKYWRKDYISQSFSGKFKYYISKKYLNIVIPDRDIPFIFIIGKDSLTDQSTGRVLTKQ